MAPAVTLPLDPEVVSYYADLAPEMGRGRTKTGVLVLMAYRGYGRLIEERISVRVGDTVIGGRTLFNKDFESLYVSPSKVPGGTATVDAEIEAELDRIAVPVQTFVHQSQVPAIRELTAGGNSLDTATAVMQESTLFARGYRLGEIPAYIREDVAAWIEPTLEDAFSIAYGGSLAEVRRTPEYVKAEEEAAKILGEISKPLTLQTVADTNTDLADLVYAARLRFPFVLKLLTHKFPRISLAEVERMAMLDGAEYWAVVPTPMWADIAEQSTLLARRMGLPTPVRGC